MEILWHTCALKWRTYPHVTGAESKTWLKATVLVTRKITPWRRHNEAIKLKGGPLWVLFHTHRNSPVDCWQWTSCQHGCTQHFLLTQSILRDHPWFDYAQDLCSEIWCLFSFTEMGVTQERKARLLPQLALKLVHVRGYSYHSLVKCTDCMSIYISSQEYFSTSLSGCTLLEKPISVVLGQSSPQFDRNLGPVLQRAWSGPHVWLKHDCPMKDDSSLLQKGQLKYLWNKRQNAVKEIIRLKSVPTLLLSRKARELL